MGIFRNHNKRFKFYKYLFNRTVITLSNSIRSFFIVVNTICSSTLLYSCEIRLRISQIEFPYIQKAVMVVKTTTFLPVHLLLEGA